MKKRVSLLIISILIIQLFTNSMASTDDMIFTDPVQNTYSGRKEATEMIANLTFSDISNDHWAKEAIIRNGALNLIKGYSDRFMPNSSVTKAEALAFIMRALGRENDVQAAATAARANLPPNSPLQTLWSLGYLNLAMQTGLITPIQYQDSLVLDQAALDPINNFRYGDPVSRQQLAFWIVAGLRVNNASVFATTATLQSSLTFSDYKDIDLANVAAVEIVTSTGIMNGDNNGRFNPTKSVTRAEMAQILKNLDNYYYGLINVIKKTGTIGGVKDNQYTNTAVGSVARSFYIRTADGSIDVLKYYMESSTSPKDQISDAPVYREGKVTGMASLVEGDEIEYLVQTNNNELLYVQVLKPYEVQIKTVQGALQTVDIVNGTISIKDARGKVFTYPLIKGLYGNDSTKDYFFLDDIKRDVKTLPLGSNVELLLKNNVCDSVKYLGEPSVSNELRGIVVENNIDFGYLSVIDANGKEISKNYYEDELKVQKKEYYDTNNEIGYISEVFPHFEYNPRDTVITEIEPGDIVFLKLDPNDDSKINSISASTNYIVKYGRIKQFSDNGDYHQLLIEYENKQTSWFDVANEIFISKDGRPINISDVKIGDWAKVLVNQAIISPGYVLESPKELVVEGDEHFISKIIKGQLAGINAVQNQLLIQNAQTMDKTGWSNYKEAEKFNISGRDIEYYYEGKRISLDYALSHLKRTNGEVYVALENNYTGDKVKKVTFRNGRDELLPADTIMNSDGNGAFNILSTTGSIITDPGTIVRRFGRLVDGNNIMIPDYAVVSLNGGNKAAVVDIMDAPDISKVTIARGRILSIDDGKSFKVQSMAVLSGNEWLYTPIQREFSIDYNTLFLNASGYVDSKAFIDYTAQSVVDKVYNIIVDGGRASHIIDSAYANKAVRGTIYENINGTLKIKDASYYENSTGKWISVSNKNATLDISIKADTIIARNNQVSKQTTLQLGDQVRIMTDNKLDKVTAGMKIDGYIVLVEK